MSQLNSTKIVVKVIIEVIGLLLLIGTFIILNRKGPFHRGFYCDDENLKHPYQDSQAIPSSFALMIWISLVLVTILPIEFLRNLMISTRPNLPRLWGIVPLPWILVDIYRTLGHCVLGGIATLLITEIAKITIGRLRPHFLTLCQPHLSHCQVNNTYTWVSDESIICSSLAMDEGPERDVLIARMNEARLSFLSGHTSSHSTRLYSSLSTSRPDSSPSSYRAPRRIISGNISVSANPSYRRSTS